MLFSVSMFPVGDADSLAQPVAEVVDEIDRAGLPYQVTAMDTVIEGEWEDVMPVIRRAEQRLRATHDRVYLTITVDDHHGVRNRIDASPKEVMQQLERRGSH